MLPNNYWIFRLQKKNYLTVYLPPTIAFVNTAFDKYRKDPLTLKALILEFGIINFLASAALTRWSITNVVIARQILLPNMLPLQKIRPRIIDVTIFLIVMTQIKMGNENKPLVYKIWIMIFLRYEKRDAQKQR